MHIEGSSISCGVRRLVIKSDEQPTKEAISTLIANNKNTCAIVMTNVPTRCRDIITLLLDNGFEQVKNPARIEHKLDKDGTVKPAFAEIASLLMHHGSQVADDVDDAANAEQFVNDTISTGLTNMALLVMHHGNELIGNLSFFIRYMNK